jgi:succinyl-diaminopimelate desuccinylase
MTSKTSQALDSSRRERLVETTLELLSFDTENLPGETTAVFEYLAATIEDLGLSVEWITDDDRKPNIVVTIPGEREWTLLYEGHVDTVPFETEQWSYDPLGERVDDRLYGRGATDMKGALAAMLETMRLYATRDEQPPITLQFAFVSDEETGGTAGIDAVLETDAIMADAAVVGETTATHDQYAIAVADKGRIWLTLEATGEAAHGSRPMCGKNAVDELYELVSGCRESITARQLSYPDAVSQIVDETVAYYERHPRREQLASRAVFEYPTVNLGHLDGGSTVNSVPGSAKAELDVRVTPGASTEAVYDQFEGCIQARDDIAIADVSMEDGTFVDPSDPFVEMVTRTGERVAGTQVFRQCATGGGDAKQLRNAGIPAVECAVGSDTAHAVDEYVSIDDIERTTDWYTRLPRELAGHVPAIETS